MSVKKVEIQDHEGNIYHPHTDAKVVFTSDGKSVEEKLESLKQSASNGKNIVATAIGTPLSSNDTFTQIGTKIDTLTQTFQNTLTEKGIEVLPNDKMSNLIDKVNNLELPPPHRVYLYNRGDECEAITGGWDIRNDVNCITTKEENCLSMRAYEYSTILRYTSIVTRKSVPLYEFDKIYMIYGYTSASRSANGNAFFRVNSSIYNKIDTNELEYSGVAKIEGFNLADSSTITVENQAKSKKDCTLKVYEIYLERRII